MRDVAAEAEAARVAILCAQRGILVWAIDPTPDYTPATRAGADEAVRFLAEAMRRAQAALDALTAQLAEADAERMSPCR